MANKTAVDDEGVFYLRPLFYGNYEYMKFDLSPSNFKIRYETFYYDCHPNWDGNDEYARKKIRKLEKKILYFKTIVYGP